VESQKQRDARLSFKHQRREERLRRKRLRADKRRTSTESARELRAVRDELEGVIGYVRYLVSITENPESFARTEQDMLSRIETLRKQLTRLREHRDKSPELVMQQRIRLKKLREREAALVNRVKIEKLIKMMRQVNDMSEELSEDLVERLENGEL
jgi:hypothetical protein